MVWLCANLPAQTPPQTRHNSRAIAQLRQDPILVLHCLQKVVLNLQPTNKKQQPTNQPNQLTHKSCVVEGGRLLCWFLVGLVYWFEFIADIPLLNQQPLPFFQLKPTTNKPLLQYPTQQRRNNNSTITNKYF